MPFFFGEPRGGVRLVAHDIVGLVRLVGIDGGSDPLNMCMAPMAIMHLAVSHILTTYFFIENLLHHLLHMPDHFQAVPGYLLTMAAVAI